MTEKEVDILIPPETREEALEMAGNAVGAFLAHHGIPQWSPVTEEEKHLFGESASLAAETLRRIHNPEDEQTFFDLRELEVRWRFERQPTRKDSKIWRQEWTSSA